MLARYKKPGGFLQLLSLIESFGPQKRDKFMEMIDLEAPEWSKAIREKMLSIDRLLTWPEQTVAEIFRTLPVKNLACALKGLTPENAAKLTKFMSHAERRKLDDEMGALNAKPEEIATTFGKILETTRRMVKDGDIRLSEVDPAMVVEDNIEMHLASGAPAAAAPAHEHVMKPEPVSHIAPAAKRAVSPEGNGPSPAEVTALQNTVAALTRENKTLKDELRHLREKLDQIKRIA